MKTELLAPGGSFASAKAAIQSGADAVYIGGAQFSARKSADNFTLSEIAELADYCHLRGAAVHVAANTLIQPRETAEFLAYIRELNRIGIDALIIQDIGMASRVRQMCPDLDLHASTQMSAASLEAVQYLENAGFSRVVLARELSKAQIQEIKAGAKAEIEVFCHGAICMCYSGQCLLSSIIGGRSGNRGMCAQPCRLSYTLLDGDTPKASGYLLSPKDMALAAHLQEMQTIGVDSLKIEGRLKRPEYVAAVTGIYRKYLDMPEKVSPADWTELENAFCRSGFTDFYWQGKTGGGMMSFQNPGNMAENRFTDAVKQRCAPEANFRKVKTELAVSLQMGKPLSVTMTDTDGNAVHAVGTVPAEPAMHKSLDRERLQSQLAKLGNTVFTAENIKINLEDGLSIPISEINSVRRQACETLAALRTKKPARRELALPELAAGAKKQPKALSVQAETEAQIRTALACGIQRIYVPADLYPKYKDQAEEIVARLPAIARQGDVPVDAKRVLAANIGQLAMYKDRICYGDFRLNVYNKESCEAFKNLEQVTLSPELNLRELQQISTPANTEIIVYGRLPLMVMENCPIKAAGKTCQNGKQQFSLQDRKKEKFPVLCGAGCLATLYNAKPLYMADKPAALAATGADTLRLLFTTESQKETETIIRAYQLALAGKKAQPMPENTFTRGHFYRGVE